MSNDIETFKQSRAGNIDNLAHLEKEEDIGVNFIKRTGKFGYSYNFDWLGLPIIQFPQDVIAMQEIIWKTKPDIIIETGVARGGSLILSASMLHLLNNNGKVLGIDIEIRSHNRDAIENHPLCNYIDLIEGSSISRDVVDEVTNHLNENHKVMVILDSNHTYDHVLNELELYSPLVTEDCYLIVMDTIIDDMPKGYFPARPWGKNNNPKIAVHEFLQTNDRFKIDKSIQNKLLITVAPDGYLKCIK